MKQRGLVFFAFAFLGVVAACTAERPRESGNLSLASDEPCFVQGIEREVRCVSIQVPLDWNQSEGEKIKVVAAIVSSSSPRPRPDPLIVLAGGPGQGGTSYGPFITSAFREVLKSRDIVLFDQRGTGRSGALDCKVQDKPWSPMDEATISAATRRCAHAFGEKVRFYSLKEVIADLDAFRRASGYGLVNLWGGSYGTLTAQQYIRKHGAHVRVAILDGAVSPARDLLNAAAVDGDRAMQILFEECRSSTDCTAQSGDLAARLEQLLLSFDTPREVQLRDPLTGESTAAVFTRDLVAQTLRGALYTTESRTLIPQAIAAAGRGELEPLAALAAYTAAWASDTMALGATLSVLCADQMPHQQAAGTETVLAGFAGDSYRRQWTSGCTEWPHNPTSAADRTTLQSTVPVLILSGGLDPVTPPSSGDEVATQFARAIHAVMPDGAHNVSPLGCAPKLIGQFVEAGSEQHLDHSCLQSIRRVPLVVSVNGPSP